MELSNEAKDFIRKCLKKEAKNRFQTLDEIVQHPWFSELDSDKMLKQSIETPWQPNLEDENPFDV